MYKITSPCCKSSPCPPEGSPIPQNPYIPSSCEHHFKEEWVSKSLPCFRETLLDIRAMAPINLQIIPNPATEVTFKEKMCSIFIDISITDDTNVIIQRGPPMPSDQHILRVEPVKEKEPAKNFNFHSTSALPKPLTWLNSWKVCMHDVIKALC